MHNSHAREDPYTLGCPVFYKSCQNLLEKIYAIQNSIEMLFANFQSFPILLTIPPKPFKYTKEISKNTKENFLHQYFEILSS